MAATDTSPSPEVHQVISKALSDPKFRDGLSTDFNGTLSAHGIAVNADEAKALQSVDWKQGVASPARGTWVHIYKTNR